MEGIIAVSRNTISEESFGLKKHIFKEKKHRDWLLEYLKNCQLLNRSDHTILNYRTDITRYIIWYESHHSKKLNLADSQTIVEYKKHLEDPRGLKKTEVSLLKRLFFWWKHLFVRKKRTTRHTNYLGLAVSSKKRHISSIKNFYEYLKQANEDRNKLFKNNPVKPKLHAVKLKEEDVKNTAFLNGQDWRRLDDRIYRPADRFLIYLMYYAGLRLTEVCELTIDSFDPTNEMMKFRRKGGYIHELHPNKAGLLFHLLGVHLEKRSLGLDEQENHFIFLNNRKRRYSSKTMYNHIMSLFKRAGCENQNLTPHSFRKACATNLYVKTKDLLLVRDYLNHSDAKVTQTYIEKSVLKTNFSNLN